MKHQNIRNIAIVAHVGHGKTSIVDTLLRQTNSLSRQDEGHHLLLDSNDQEQERGRMMIQPCGQVYKGQIVGAAVTQSDLYVNCRQGKQLARVWRATADKTMR